MDLNHIELPPTLAAELYRDLLVMDDLSAATNTGPVLNLQAPGTETAASPHKKWPSLGENRQYVLVVTEQRDTFHMPDSELDFLTKILGACKLTLADVAVVNLNNYEPASFSGIADHFNSKIVLLFGVEPAYFALPISFPHFQVQAHGKASYLFSPTLKDLENNAVLKSKCWVCLQRIFNIKKN